MFKGPYIALVFVQICLIGCVKIQPTEDSAMKGYTHHIVIMPGQICPEKMRSTILVNQEIAHKNAKICYYG